MKKRYFQNCVSKAKKIFELDAKRFRELLECTQAMECVANINVIECPSRLMLPSSQKELSGGVSDSGVFMSKSP